MQASTWGPEHDESLEKETPSAYHFDMVSCEFFAGVSELGCGNELH